MTQPISQTAKPFCRDCADHNGVCPTDGSFCSLDVEERHAAIMKKTMFKRVELDHLLTLMRDASQDGSYYGPRQQYRSRHDRIWNKLIAQWRELTGGEYPLKSRDNRHG